MAELGSREDCLQERLRWGAFDLRIARIEKWECFLYGITVGVVFGLLVVSFF